MNILSVDTTTRKASVSLKIGNKTVKREIENNITHSEKLLPLIDSLLNENNLKLEDIDKYLILNGPGSFTGIRISLATIKAFSQIYKKDIFSISSCEALAFIGNTLSNKKYILSLIDAKNDRVYFSLYKFENIDNKISVTPLFDIKNEYLDDALLIINNYLNENNVDINEVYKISNVHFENFANCKVTYPSTNDLIYIFENIYNCKNYIFDAFSLNANYARSSQAERVKNGEC